MYEICLVLPFHPNVAWRGWFLHLNYWYFIVPMPMMILTFKREGEGDRIHEKRGINDVGSVSCENLLANAPSL